MKTEELKQDLIVNPLIPNRIVTIEPVIRQGGWLQQQHKNHAGAFLLPGAKRRFKGVPYLIDDRKFIDPLTEEEKKYFYSKESGLGIEEGDLSIYKKKNYWSRFEVVVKKEEMKLNLGDPMDYLRWKFLLAQKDIFAPSWEERFNKGTYLYAIKDEEDMRDKENERIEMKVTVMDYFAKIRKSERKMRALLTLFYAKDKHNSKKIPHNATMSFLTTEVNRIMENDTKWVFELLADPFFDERVLVEQAIAGGAITKLSAAEYQIIGEEDVLNLKELLQFLNNNKNQAIRAKIEAQLEVQK